MTKYETFTFEFTDGTKQDFVTVYLDDNNAKTFPVDESNADYVAWLAEQDGGN